MTNPKMFVSYSWSNPDHEAWVVELATELREAGIDVILDKWDLREGQDAHAFMERMVTDPDIQKVALICDQVYAKKANSRTGGVGTETQIVSAEIYAQQNEAKFVAVVTELDENEVAFVPAYYKSRIYINFTDTARHSESFEQLVRWAYNQPLHKKLELGTKPAFLEDGEGSLRLPTSAPFRRAIDALRSNRDHAIPAVREYFSVLAEHLEKLRLTSESEPFDEAVVESIHTFLPFRNEAISMFSTLAVYHDDDEARVAIHRFFEELMPYLDRLSDVNSWRVTDFDNFRFIIHELFLYAIASLAKYERFNSVDYLLRNGYYAPARSDAGNDVMVSFVAFQQEIKSFDIRNHRLNCRRVSLLADFLKDRCKSVEVELRHLMQADLIMFVRSCIDSEASYEKWWPETLLFASRFSGPLEIFARARSTMFFDRMKVVLGVTSKDELQLLMEEFASDRRRKPRWGYDSVEPARVLGFEAMATKP